MATVTRYYWPEYGGCAVFTDAPQEQNNAIYLSPTRVATYITGGVLNATGITFVDTVLQARQTARDLETKLTKTNVAGDKARNKINSLINAALEFVTANPDTTEDQLKAAFVSQLKAWAASWTGD